MRNGGGVSLRHAFQAAAPCLSNATCSSFAMGASWFRYGYSVGYGVLCKGGRPPRSPDYSFKNPEAPAVKREAEEEWGR
jgi:hypothetical protein